MWTPSTLQMGSPQQVRQELPVLPVCLHADWVCDAADEASCVRTSGQQSAFILCCAV